MADFFSKVKAFISEVRKRPVTMGAYGAACFLIGAFLL